MPAEHETTTTTPHKTVAPTKTIGSVHTTTTGARTTTTTRANSRSITASITTSTTTRTATPTISPVPEAGGLSGAAIGGMAAGGAAVVAIIGLLCYKRRKRAAVGDSTTAAAAKKKDAEAMAELGGAYTGPSKAISGPMALAPPADGDPAPAYRPEAQFREQQQFRPGMREELLAQPGSALHNTMSKSPTSPGAPPRPPAPPTYLNSDQANNNNQGNQANQDNNRPPLQKQHSHPGSDGYYDDVNDYYGDDSMSVVPDQSMGAQRSTPQPRNLTQGNLTPTPVTLAATAAAATTGGMGSPSSPSKKVKPDSPRSSYSSEGGESAYLTLEQAQQAHNNKMMGHKESISSVDMLLERSSPNAVGQYQNQGPNSPYGFNGNSNSNLAPPARSPMPPMSPDPYAESAYSDYPDDRSMTPNAYRPPPPSGGGSPYGGYQQQQPYNGQQQQQQGGNGYKQPPSPVRDSDYNQGPYGRY
ncbi:hypothetical protein EC957_008591 [Mortierella hygrophila]|uniref:Uncharacterized protein n=1 Tax=Mortierella hygrophila TaxID=979708 RepID=A0A9P6EXG7_9FUNG|nr:hypothetical protein EC957_008591 [Mortierella hygrophila]